MDFEKTRKGQKVPDKVVRDLAEKWRTQITDREDLMMSLRDVMAQMTDVFGDPVSSSSWSRIQKNIQGVHAEDLQRTLAVFLRNFKSTTGILAEQVWCVLRARKVVQEGFLTMFGSNAEEAFKTWCSRLAAAKWDNCNDHKALTEDLRKVMKLDHKWKIYTGCRHSGVDLEDYRSYREETTGHGCHQELLIAEIHAGSEFSGFCIEGGKVKMLPEKLEQGHLEKSDDPAHLVYYWAHECDHAILEGWGHKEKDGMKEELDVILVKTWHGPQRDEKNLFKQLLSP